MKKQTIRLSEDRFDKLVERIVSESVKKVLKEEIDNSYDKHNVQYDCVNAFNDICLGLETLKRNGLYDMSTKAVSHFLRAKRKLEPYARDGFSVP